MILRSILLQDFRNYSQKKFDFDENLTLVIGPNTAGKTNLSEAIHMLLVGKSFRTSSDVDMIGFDREIARVQGLLRDGQERIKVEMILASAQATGSRFSKKFQVNGIIKSRNSATGFLPLVLFRPEELDIITDGPALRRAFLDEVLEQVDRDYREAKTTYDRGLRQRNALLREAQENGTRNAQQFTYWDELLIQNGQYLTEKRREFLDFINISTHDIFSLKTTYDTSIISKERLEQYKDAEIGAGVTLVGPHRDDFVVGMSSHESKPHPDPLLKGEGSQGEKIAMDLRHFGSRGQQRLAVLQLKFLQIAYIKKIAGMPPLLVLDDIFSELDGGHIQLVLDNIQGCQIILTTTHKEFIPEKTLRDASVVELVK